MADNTFFKGSAMATFLLSGHNGPLVSDGRQSIEQIAQALAGAGLRTVTLAELEWAAARNALEACGGNRTHAAKLLGISVRTLQRKLKEHGLTDPPA
jgi:DNA-binding protein Fis